jgi:glycoside/pentoside/hexuronide:cation symporter, GPH family
VLASALPSWAGLPVSATVFVITLGLGLWLWRWAPVPTLPAVTQASAMPLAAPLRDGRFVRLLMVFVVNGMASAVPATLVLFFVQDRLQASAAQEPLFLLAYFACAGLAIPLWLRLIARIGLVRAWGAGMVLSIAVFAWASTLGAGDITAFLVICALSGAALGGDLACPPALLAGQLQAQGHASNTTKNIAAIAQEQGAGAYFGWWNMAAKLSLALAAGVALPLLGWAGYEPGIRSDQGLMALTLAYCVLPCVLKAVALAALLAYRRAITQPLLVLPFAASQAV